MLRTQGFLPEGARKEILQLRFRAPGIAKRYRLRWELSALVYYDGLVRVNAIRLCLLRLAKTFNDDGRVQGFGVLA